MTSSKKKKSSAPFKWSSAYIYLIPWFVGLTVFRIYPFIEAFRISMFDIRIGRPETFVGMDNFMELLTGTSLNGTMFRHSVGVTIRYVMLTVPLVLVFALFVAFVLNFKIKGIGFFRTAFYIPSILGGSVAIALLWRSVWGNDGLVNSFIGIFGIAPVGWMVQEGTALLIIALLRAWQFGSVMLIFLSALQNVPQTLYEAASIDGAKKWRQFFTITIPMITPTILFNLVQLITGAFQEFNAPFLVFANPGGPNGAAMLLNVFIYQRAFEMNNFGISAAASWMMFLMIMVGTLILFKTSNKWTFYND